MSEVDMDRMYYLTKHAFEKATGTVVPDDVKDTLISIEIVEEAFECPYYTGKCSGELRKLKCLIPCTGWQIRMVARSCVPNSSWAHELIHLFAYSVLGSANGGHTDPRLWGSLPSAAVNAANAAGRYEGMCD